MKVLGISGLTHDSAAALCVDGEIVVAVQEERFSRIKGDSGFPVMAIEYCLNSSKIHQSELDAVVYYENPFLMYDRWIHNIAYLGEDCSEMIDMSLQSIFKKRLWIQKLVEKQLGMFCKTGKLLVTKHHIAHAASAFFPSPFKNAAIITADGVGEWNTTTIGCGRNNKINIIKQINYPHSLGLLYSAMTYFCGFKVNSGEYKLMGLAPYGEPKYVNKIKNELIDIKKDGSYHLNMDYFNFYKDKVMINERFSNLFNGPPRISESIITKREMDLAASIQNITEEIMVLLAQTAFKLTGMENLVMAGGIALNCVANTKILSEKIFKDIWIQPAAGDAGGAIGAALYAYYEVFSAKRNVNLKDSQKGSYLGPHYSFDEIKIDFDRVNAKYKEYLNKNDLYCKVAKQLAEGKIIGFFNGRMEFGPRALGARSILGDPRNPDMQEKMNLKIKFRESFRPFAPAVLEEKASEYFDINQKSPYMLFVANVKKERRCEFNLKDSISDEDLGFDMLPIVKKIRSDIPAVTHIDFSARVQTVNKSDNPDFYNLISKFEKLTGCPVIVNTSFNIRGEPIVCTPEDAYKCFMQTDIDVLIVENFMLLKEEQPYFENINNQRKKYELD